MVIPFQYFGTWERGRDIVVYLGWEMAGLGNRTLCHSLCHSLCDPDLFPAFLTPPLSWGKWCSSCNPHSILTKSWDTVMKKWDSCLKGWPCVLHNWVSTCLPGFALHCSFLRTLDFSPGGRLAVSLHNAQFFIPFLDVCCWCFSAFLSSNPVLQFSLTFPSSQIIWLFSLAISLAYKFLAAVSVECNVLVSSISSSTEYVIEALKYLIDQMIFTLAP